jgi:predicted nucleic acid-binding Zn ribbon protein
MSMEPVSGALSRLFGRLGIERGLLGWQAVEKWPGLVGPRIARHTHAVAFRDGVLQVEVEGSAWMHELTILRRDLVRAINRSLGSECVKDVRFLVSRGGIPK